MTSPPPYAYAPAPASRATGGLLALSIVGIIYSVLFRLCCGSAALMGALIMMLMSSGALQDIAGMPELESMPEMEMLFSPQMQSFNFINGFVLLFLGIGMLAGAIALLRLKPWGRTLSLAAAAGEIAWAIVVFGINLFFVYPAMNQMMGEGAPAGPQMIGSIIGGVFGTFMTLAFPVAVLIVLNLKSIKGQFDGPIDMRQIV